MSETGFTALILASAGGHVEVVKTLVEKVNMSSREGAFYNGHFKKKCLLLLERFW